MHDLPAHDFGDLVKVAFPIQDKPGEVESMWTQPEGSGRFRVLNVPLLVFGVSYGDTVAADEESGRLVYRAIVSRGGHSTYRIMVSEHIGASDFEAHWSKLRALGCGYERASGRFLAVDVPPGADIYQAYRLLEEGMAAGLWLFDEGHCGHPVRA